MNVGYKIVIHKFQSNCYCTSKDKNVRQFIGQWLYKSLHNGKLSKRAQEVTGIPLINFNLPQPHKEPLKRTFSACTTSGKGIFNYYTMAKMTLKKGSHNFEIK